jgi:hypothetical protein
MRKSCFNDEFLVLLGPIISRVFACLYEGKNKPKQQRVHAPVLSLWLVVNGHEQKNKSPSRFSRHFYEELYNLENVFN